jgi:hypothetical protein
VEVVALIRRALSEDYGGGEAGKKIQKFLSDINGSNRVARTWNMMKGVIFHRTEENIANSGIRRIQTVKQRLHVAVH